MHQRRLRAALVLAYSAFVLAMWVPRALAARWIADDFTFTESSMRDGFWRAQEIVYTTAAGRYSVAFLYGVLGHLGTHSTPYLAIGSMALWLVAAWRCAHHVFRLTGANASRLEELAAGAGFVAATTNAAPNEYQALIWINGLLTYGLPIIGATVIAWMLLRPNPMPVAASILAFVIGGCSEVAAVAQIAFFGLLAMLWPRARRPLLAVAAASAVALIIIVIAPGNFARRSRFDTALPLADAIGHAIMTTPAMFAGILARGYPLFLSLVVFLALAGSERRPLSARTAILILAASAGVLFATLCGFLYGTGKLPWARVQFVPVAYVSIALVFVALAIALPRSRALAIALTVSMAIVGIAGLAATLPIRMQAIRESYEFAAEADRVEATARQHRGADLVIAAPRTYDYLEYLHPDPQFWTNRCMAYHFGLRSIRAAAPSVRR